MFVRLLPRQSQTMPRGRSSRPYSCSYLRDPVRPPNYSRVHLRPRLQGIKRGYRGIFVSQEKLMRANADAVTTTAREQEWRTMIIPKAATDTVLLVSPSLTR